jgi:hypothetical protein
MFANSPQRNVLCLFQGANGKQDTMFASVDVFLNTLLVYSSDAQPVFRGTPVCRREHLGVPRNFHLSL